MNASSYQFGSPRETVQAHLPDGRVVDGPRGAGVGGFLRLTSEERDPTVAAIVNGELHELTFPMDMDARVQPVTMSSADGARIYRRSLTFLLEMAFSELFPQARLTIDHSVSFGGYYCQVKNGHPLTPTQLAGLESRMFELVFKDLPFERREVPLEQAIAYLKSRGYDDKVHLLAHRRKPYLTLYSLGNAMDYHHGYMVPSTGYLRWFAISPAEGGFTLLYPRRHSPTELEPLSDYPKLLAAFRQYGDWLTRLEIDNVGSLNDAIAGGRSHEVILVSEALHEQHIAELAYQISRRSDQARLILIAGPTSSGKTTISRRLTIQLLAHGFSPFPLELDNYFVDRDKTPPGEDGRPDFEALEALNLDLLAAHLEALIAGKEVQLPHYDFRAGSALPGDAVRLRPEQPIILEGIHGLNPRLIPASMAGNAFRIYVSALTQINLDRHNRVSTTDTRLLRRILRDERERGYSAQQTISQWESVRRGEKRHIFPYQENADVMFNSALVYELAVMKPLVEPLLRQVSFGTHEYIEAKRLLAFLDWFLPMDLETVPRNSIVREFLGGSVLKEFRAWGS
jgi:uridine kinase